MRRAQRAVVVATEVRRYVAVGAERDRHAAPVECAQQVGARIQLAGRLAQARGRDLDRDPGGGDRICRLLVLAVHDRPARGVAEHLGQVEVREHVEEPGGGRRPHLGEVAAPDLVDRHVLPDREVGMVDRQAAQPVHGAEDEVEIAMLDERRELVLAPLDPVELDPAGDGLAVGPHRRHVGVEVGLRALVPEGVVEQAGGLPKAVAVLGQADVVDSASACGLGVLGHAGGRQLRRAEGGSVGREMQVIVDEHGSRRASRANALSAPNRRALPPRPPPAPTPRTPRPRPACRPRRAPWAHRRARCCAARGCRSRPR